MLNIEFFTDENNNRCYVKFFGNIDDARAAINSLVDCKDCINCSYCNGCIGCERCTECDNCDDCWDCDNCFDSMESSGKKNGKYIYNIPKHKPI